jgi:glyceraldehyde 3-phosphate dehydrogenase
MAIRLGINGFGRIGRNTFRSLLKRGNGDLEVAAINDLTDNATLSHLFQFDSLYGELGQKVQTRGKNIIVDGRRVRVFTEPDPSHIPWDEEGVDIVIEATGRFRTREAVGKHLGESVQKVIVTTPVNDADFMVVLGINEKDYDPKNHHILSNASCTTNALAPVVKVLDEKFTLLRGLMNTTHSYTNDQQLLDLPHPDLRRARAAAINIIPTSTGAARSVGRIIPKMKGKIDGFAVRVPTPTVSIVDLVGHVSSSVSTEDVNAAFAAAAEAGDLKGILGYESRPLVSNDFVGSPYSSVVDGLLTMVVDETLLRVVAWYDNEWGYSCRVADLASLVGRQMR